MNLTDRGRRWLDRLNQSPHALWLLAVMSFLETIIVPIPIEVVLIPFMLTNRHRIWLIATVVTAACIAASLLGYAIGYLFYQSIGVWFLETFGHQAAYESFTQLFDDYGFVAVFVVGILPIPFQLAMLAAGLTEYPLPLFVLATLIARGLRYYGLAWLVYAFGDRARKLWDRHALLTSLGAVAILAAIVIGGNYAANQLV